jgi:hypothetical protein
MHPNQPNADRDKDRRDRSTERTHGSQEYADRAAESAPGHREDDADLEKRQDQLLDEAVEETFPASDPISPKRIT